MRAIYGAAVFDWCLDNDIHYDYCLGVSAGSANIASFLGKQKGRNYRYYAQYSRRKAYMSWGNYLKKGSYLDLEYVYGTMANHGGEDPLDWKTIEKDSSIYLTVATNAKTGKPVYFPKNAMRQDDYRVMMASSCLPLACRAYRIDGVPYYDGGLSDPVPVRKAVADGCDKVVVLLSRPLDFVRTPKKDIFPSRLIGLRYPKAGEGLRNRAALYNDGVAFAKELQKNGKALIIAPDTIEGIDTLGKDAEALKRLYRKGLHDAEQIKDFLKT